MNPLANWPTWLIVAIAALVSVLFCLPTYYLGRQGMPAIQKKFPDVSDDRWKQIQSWFDRWKSLILLLTVLPGLGTILPAIAGAEGIRFGVFLLWVYIAKFIRWWIIVFITYGGLHVIKNS